MKNQRLINLVFHPILWCLPFLAMIGYSSFLILNFGLFAKLPFESARHSCLNVIFFSSLWLFSMYIFSKMKLSRMERIYYSFTVIFSAYGLGETLFQILWSDIVLLGKGSFPVNTDRLVWWVRNSAYCAFFLFNNVPLYLLLKKRGNDRVRLFKFLVIATVPIWIVHYLMGVYIQSGIYFVGRFFTILAYIVFLWGFLGRGTGS